MSRIKSDKINLGTSVVVDFFSNQEPEEQLVSQEQEEERLLLSERESKINLMEREAEAKVQKMLDEAAREAQNILESANIEAQGLKNRAQELLDCAAKKGDEILDEAKIEAQKIKETAQQEALGIKETASQEGAKEGYEAGYTDGCEKIRQELLQKIIAMDEIAKNAFEMKNKIMSSSKREIVELVLMIAKKVCIDSVDKNALIHLVNESVKFLSDKENIELILSEKYARLLNEILNNTLNSDTAQTEIDIDKLRSIKLSYNSKMSDDTLIIQTPKERLDLGFETQLNQIAQKFKECLNAFDESQPAENKEETLG